MTDRNESLIEKLEAFYERSDDIRAKSAIRGCIAIIRQHTAAPDVDRVAKALEPFCAKALHPMSRENEQLFQDNRTMAAKAAIAAMDRTPAREYSDKNATENGESMGCDGSDRTPVPDVEKVAMAIKVAWLGTNDVGANLGVGWTTLAKAAIAAMGDASTRKDEGVCASELASPANNEACREAFEKWYWNEYGSVIENDIHGRDSYKAWQAAWDNRREISLRRCATVVWNRWRGLSKKRMILITAAVLDAAGVKYVD